MCIKMMGIIHWLLGICRHDYEVFDWVHLVDARQVKVGRRFFMKCKKCGKLKKKDLQSD